MARENDISALGATIFTVGVGATAAILFQPSQGQVASVNLKAQSGTFLFFGIPGGMSSLAAAQGGSIVGTSLIAGASVGYLLNQNEVLSINGAPIFYIAQASGGATGTLYALFGRTGQWFN